MIRRLGSSSEALNLTATSDVVGEVFVGVNIDGAVFFPYADDGGVHSVLCFKPLDRVLLARRHLCCVGLAHKTKIDPLAGFVKGYWQSCFVRNGA